VLTRLAGFNAGQLMLALLSKVDMEGAVSVSCEGATVAVIRREPATYTATFTPSTLQAGDNGCRNGVLACYLFANDAIGRMSD
jgi:hypothetical protein